MYGLALCLPSVGQPQGLPVPHEIPKTLICIYTVPHPNPLPLFIKFLIG